MEKLGYTYKAISTPKIISEKVQEIDELALVVFDVEIKILEAMKELDQ